MLFNSIEFVLFFPLVLLLYWGFFNRTPFAFSASFFEKNRLLLSRIRGENRRISQRSQSRVKVRNLFLLAASYVFYGWWEYRFLGLIVLSSVVDFFCGKSIFQAKTRKAKRFFLSMSLLVNLGILFFFKYYGFFIDELTVLFEAWGYTVRSTSLNIILPIGISFYTFQTLSYTLDIYRGRLSPTNDAVAFFTFVSFFPQLVAGPIERAKHLLPQFSALKKFDYDLAANGFRQLLWGFFAKIAVADSVAPIVESIFTHHETTGAGTLALGAILFSIQIFGDFAGYSNIAVGTAAILGFDLMQNFNMPFFSRNIREFWSRWHISLSTWFRDYVYIPMGGNRCSNFRYMINVMITFVVSGLWHGANWTFLAWGSLHGLFYLLAKPFSSKSRSDNLQLKQWPAMLGTFLLVVIAFIFFRAENLEQAWRFLSRIAWMEKGQNIMDFVSIRKVVPAIFFSILLFIVEWYQRERRHGLDIAFARPLVRHVAYYLVISAILFAFQTDRVFIYFQF